MSVIEEKSTSRITSEGLDLLDCFVAGLDSVVYQIAEHTARNRLDKIDPAQPVEIAAEDVVRAGEEVIHFLREMIKQTSSPELGPILDQVERSFSSQRARTA